MTQTSNGRYDVDVLVCGGGCAGVGAALAAARNGARTLLVEWAGFAGGIMTAVGLPFFDGIADIRDNRIVTPGIAKELFVRMGGCAPDATHVEKHNPTIDNIERYKLLLDQLLRSEGDRLRALYHSFVCDARVQGDQIVEVMVANKAGLVSVRPRIVIDCTGDADVAARAGAPTEKLRELQPMTLHFRIGNVQQSPTIRQRCREAVEQAHANGDLPIYYGPGISFMFAPNEIYIHAIRVPADGTDPEQLTRAEMQGRADAWTMFEYWKRHVPEFKEAYFISSGPFIGVRETRRIVGQHVLTEQDIVAGKAFEDAIATGCWYLDQHPNRATAGSAQDTPKIQPDPYDIPYRSLLPQKIANLLVAGRCHSATQLAASSTRVTATAMTMGEAAGTAAAMAAGQKQSPQELEGVNVRRRLDARWAAPIVV